MRWALLGLLLIPALALAQQPDDLQALAIQKLQAETIYQQAVLKRVAVEMQGLVNERDYWRAYAGFAPK